jgi:hypothetical protein
MSYDSDSYFPSNTAMKGGGTPAAAAAEEEEDERDEM